MKKVSAVGKNLFRKVSKSKIKLISRTHKYPQDIPEKQCDAGEK